jgi:hypothetical protein
MYPTITTHSSLPIGAAPGTLCSAAPVTHMYPKITTHSSPSIGAAPGTLCGAAPGTCMCRTTKTHLSPPIENSATELNYSMTGSNHPSLKWLEKKILNLYAQLTEIRRYAEKKCRKILTPDSKFSPTIRMWYDRIHAYQQLIKLKEGKTNKARNKFRFARKNNILNQEKLTLKELNDGLQLACIHKKSLNKQAGELRKLHLRECLIQAQIKKQPTKIQAIKQRMQQEQSKKYGT